MTDLLAIYGTETIVEKGTEKMKRFVQENLLTQDEADWIERFIERYDATININMGKKNKNDFKNKALRNTVRHEKTKTGSTLTTRQVTPFHGDYVLGSHHVENGKFVSRENVKMEDVYTTALVHIKRKDYAPHRETPKVNESHTLYVYIPTDRLSEKYL